MNMAELFCDKFWLSYCRDGPLTVSNNCAMHNYLCDAQLFMR